MGLLLTGSGEIYKLYAVPELRSRPALSLNTRSVAYKSRCLRMEGDDLYVDSLFLVVFLSRVFVYFSFPTTGAHFPFAHRLRINRRLGYCGRIDC